ncbi:grainyhead-like [Linnemannia exigua]|uniref:Grainyhead-like n=1 Tax=Linnemannia exigua TaxID=604196 RepID=A0AAD4H771_9FUNG|nr:grainyhead-like [Linnemannia exigua]
MAVFLRFKVTLDAQTAAMQHQGDSPSTYLNKGQFYTLSIQDTEEFDGDIHTVIRIAFHEEAHRKLAARYWSFWLSQQANPKTARALDIERASSTGMLEVQAKTFDRTHFKWNGKEGTKLMIRFNCLSTDFSRIKGVKGIPLRIQMETFEPGFNGGDIVGRGAGPGGNGGDGSLMSRGRILEKSFAKIKLFRDKGAERKNKDDQKHLEKMWDKMRGKNADTNPLSQVLASVQHVSTFYECPEDEEEYPANGDQGDGGGGGGSRSSGSDAGGGDNSSVSGEGMECSNQQQSGSPDDESELQDKDTGSQSKRRRMNDPTAGHRGSGSDAGGLNFIGSGRSMSSSSNSSAGAGGGLAASAGQLQLSNNNTNDATSNSDLLDRDPSYIPQHRKKKPMTMLCLYIKIGNEAVYRAIYLERPVLHELTQKLCEKLEIQASTVSAVFRKTTRKNLLVRADDTMVAQMPEELDMEVEYDFNQQDGSVNLLLKY